MKNEIGTEKGGMKERHLVNVKEAAEYLAISPTSLRRNQWNGGIPYVRIGKRILFDIKDLDRFIEMNKYTLDLVRRKSYHELGTA
jgi:excisionase family DNA binding protein